MTQQPDQTPSPSTDPAADPAATTRILIVEDDESTAEAMAFHMRAAGMEPVVAGDELTATLTVTNVKTLGGNSMVTAESNVTDASGAHVVTAVSTLVVRGEDS